MKNIPEYQLNFYKMIAEQTKDKKFTIVYPRKNGLTTLKKIIEKGEK